MKKYTKRKVETEAAYFHGSAGSVEDLKISLGKALVDIRQLGQSEKYELTIKNFNGEKFLVKPTQWILKENLTDGVVNFSAVNDEDFNAIFDLEAPVNFQGLSTDQIEEILAESSEEIKESKKKNK